MQNPTPCGVVVLFPWQRRTLWHDVFSKTIFTTHCLTNQDSPCQWNEGLALSCNLLQSNREAAIVRGRVLPDEAPTSSIAFVVPPVRAPCGVPAAMLFILLRPWLCFLGGAWGGGGLSILGVEHSVCSCSLQMSPHEPFFFPGLLTR